MAFSYSGIVNYGKATLPSVESWGSNNNILRDPPRSITTRRLDKVSETSMTTEDIDMSGERIAESISVYPRGVNVMVGVSFNNGGLNGGQGSGQQSFYGSQQTKLPYRIMRDGAFRPPLLTAKDLLPLSRLPRNKTKIDPIAYTPNFQKRLVCQGQAQDYRSVKNETIQVQATAPKIQYIRKPTEISVQQNIQPHLLQIQSETLKTRNVARPVEIAVQQNIQPHVSYDFETLKTRRIEMPIEISGKQSIQTKLSVQGQTQKTQKQARPVEISAKQSIQAKLPVQGQTQRTQKQDRPIEISAKQSIQAKLPVQGQTQKTQKQDRPIEVSGRQSIQVKLPIQGQTLRTQRQERPMEIGVNQNIQTKLSVQGGTFKIQNIAKPVEIAVNQNIQNKLLYDAPSTKRMYDFSNKSTKYTGDSVKDHQIHYDTKSNPSQNINKVTVQSKITYHMNERPQSQLSTEANRSGVPKHVQHETREIKQRPSLSGEIKVNSSMQGMSNPKLILEDKKIALPDRMQIGGTQMAQNIPSSARGMDVHSISLKSKNFSNMMRNSNN